MQRRFVSLLAILMVTGGLLCAATVSTEVPEYVWDQGKPLYPALVYAVTHGQGNHWVDAVLSAIDIDKNEYVIKNVNGNSGLKLARFTLTITVNNGRLTYATSEIQTRTPGRGAWGNASSLVMFDMRILSNHFNTVLPQVMNDSALYATAISESAALFSLMNRLPPEASRIVSDSLENPENRLFYPAVYKIFNEIKAQFPGMGRSVLKIDDVAANRFSIGPVIVPAASAIKVYTLSVVYQDGFLNYGITNIKDPSSADLASLNEQGLKALPVFLIGDFARSMTPGISRIFANQAEYSNAKQEFLSDPLRLILTVQDLNTIVLTEFINSDLT